MGAKPEPPCDHWDDQIGTVSAGDSRPGGGAFCGVTTCRDCVAKSQGYVQMRTGLPPTDLLTFEESRSGAVSASAVVQSTGGVSHPRG